MHYSSSSARVILILSIVMSFSSSLFAQTIADLESDLKTAVSFDRLDILHRLTEKYIEINDRRSTKYARQAVTLANNLFQGEMNDNRWIGSYLLLAESYYSREKYYTAQENFIAVKALANPDLHGRFIKSADLYLQKIDSIANSEGGLNEGFLSKTFSDLDVGNAISSTSSNVLINNYLKQAEKAIENNEIDKAIDLYERAIYELEKKGELGRLQEVYRNIGSAYMLKGDKKRSDEFYEKARGVTSPPDSLVVDLKESKEVIKRSDSVIAALKPEGYEIQQEPEQNVEKPPTIIRQQESITSSIENLDLQRDNLEEIARQAEERNDYKTLAAVNAELARVTEERNELKGKEQELALVKATSQRLQAELQSEANLRRVFVVGSITLFAFFISMGWMYIGKRKDHNKLTVAYIKLDDTKNELSKAQKKIKTLLNQQVSGDIAEALLESNSDKPSDRKFVCIMFLDIRDFTPFAEQLAPEELIKYQNDVFGLMIEIINEKKGNINQFMGDGFMATFGAPISHGNDCQNAYDAALAILKKIRKESLNGSIPETKLGIGLHAGHVVTGNVGTDLRKQYSITGNTVIISARLEQLNKKYNSQLVLSESVFEKLDEKPEGKFIEVQVKGREKPLNIMAIG